MVKLLTLVRSATKKQCLAYCWSFDRFSQNRALFFEWFQHVHLISGVYCIKLRYWEFLELNYRSLYTPKFCHVNAGTWLYVSVVVSFWNLYKKYLQLPHMYVTETWLQDCLIKSNNSMKTLCSRPTEPAPRIICSFTSQPLPNRVQQESRTQQHWLSVIFTHILQKWNEILNYGLFGGIHKYM